MMTINLTDPALPSGMSSLDERVGYALRRAQMLVFQYLVEQLAPYDLRPAQFTALAIIHDTPGITQAELARGLAIEPPQAVPLLNKLEAMELAVRVRGKTDRRAYGLYLTDRGETLLTELHQVAARSDVEATANLNDDERALLLTLLRKVYAA